jgi:hypothetical protein
MPLQLTDAGDRLEPGRHEATLAEIEAVFVAGFPASTRRGPLFDSFRALRAAMMRVVPIREQWVNGSFVTDKSEPGDIDLVTIFDGETVDALDPASVVLLKGLVADKVSQQLHGCDSYYVGYYADGSPHRTVYLDARAYWESWFGADRTGAPKGYVVVVDDD